MATIIKFKNSVHKFSMKVEAIIEPGEFNYTTNHTIEKYIENYFTDNSVNTDYYDEVYDGREDAINSIPMFVSEIGLYNDENDLLAIAKLTTPIEIPKRQRIVFLLELDF